ncbi:nitroreductase [Sphingomonas baiyangensis]|uniref:Nitroreductase n=1 Tax=Sphingomonas baiyangensis TaxID=2572576 RepID=A0A4U1L8R5_9SPHN|nr:nitroreductase [Sphingomonas baiyangensis]
MREAIAQRRSVRAFLPDRVDPALVRELVALAGRSPSGGNLQPWHVDLVHGGAMMRLKALMERRIVEAPMGEGAEYAVYPPQMAARFDKRRRGVGQAMYAALGIDRADRARRQAVFADNFRFFGAPMAIFISVERDHGPPQWADCGMFLQSLMLLLVEAGLDSCAQEAWAMYPRTLGDFLRLPPDRMLFTGLAIGRRDTHAPVNRFAVDRADTGEWLAEHDS